MLEVGPTHLAHLAACDLKSQIFYEPQFLHLENGPTAVFGMFGVNEMSLKATIQFLKPQTEKSSLTFPFPHCHHLQFRALTVGFALKM